MSRGLSSLNAGEVEASSLHEVVLVKLEFDTPVYVHSGFGDISYDGNTYLGVGDFGGVSQARESELLGPDPLTLQLSGVDSDYITEALDSGNYGDVITLYVGYRQDNGLLVDDPWLCWRGTFEYASVSLGDDNVVEVTAAHDLQILNDADGARYSEEEQKARYSGDTGLDHIARMAGTRLLWAGGPVGGRGDWSNEDRGPNQRPGLGNID